MFILIIAALIKLVLIGGKQVIVKVIILWHNLY